MRVVPTLPAVEEPSEDEEPSVSQRMAPPMASAPPAPAAMVAVFRWDSASSRSWASRASPSGGGSPLSKASLNSLAFELELVSRMPETTSPTPPTAMPLMPAGVFQVRPWGPPS